MSWVVVGVTVASSIYKGYQANKAGNAAAAEQKRANAEMAEQKRKLQALDMSNPYENMQNTMEDLTINQQQTDYLTQQAQINQAITGQLNNARADKQAADTAANNAATAQQQAVMSGVGGVAAGVSTGLDNTQDGGNFFTGN